VSVSAGDVAGRLGRLADTLAELKDRVRSAVAGETGRAVGEAIRDLLTAALSGRLISTRPTYRSPTSSWNEGSDRWDDNDDGDRYGRSVRSTWHDDDEATPSEVRTPTNPPTWPTAVAAGAAAVRWWLTRRVSGWAALGLGFVVGAAALAGGPIARAGLALVAAAADLVPTLHPLTEWGLTPYST
jgi:hypothetical protein